MVSVEMIEAVGPRVLVDVLPDARPRCWRPADGSAIQAITMPHDRMLATRHTYTWINKYIFPGGFLPSVQAIERDHPRATPRCGCGPAVAGRALRRDPRRWDDAFLAAR